MKVKSLLLGLVATLGAIILLDGLLIGILLALSIIDGRRVGRGADSFVSTAIATLQSGGMPVLDPNISESDKTKILDIAANWPKGKYKIEYVDYFYGLWEYEIKFENGETYYCAVDAPGTFMTLFAKPRYELQILRRKTESPPNTLEEQKNKSTTTVLK
jgi:hypothetical protein